MLYTQSDVAKLGSILGIWAHPDDECWASAGLMKIASDNGQRIGIITATNGEAGETADKDKWPIIELAKIRIDEQDKCLRNIGLVNQYWLGFKDGKLIATDENAAINEIIRIINVFSPDTIITFEPNGITGHDDHKAISMWANKAVKKMENNITVLQSIESREKHDTVGQLLDDKYNIFFNIDKPKLVPESEADVLIKLNEDVLECKMNCLKAHESQTNHMFSDNEGVNALK